MLLLPSISQRESREVGQNESSTKTTKKGSPRWRMVKRRKIQHGKKGSNARGTVCPRAEAGKKIVPVLIAAS